MKAEESVILVDENDNEIGVMEKMEAHIQGKRHRAFSIFLFNKKGELLLQKRAADKYHSAGKWTNTCCSHPRPGEATEDAANRRLGEEMGMEADISKAFSFLYDTEIMPGITEHEYDHVYIGITDVLPVLNPAEASAYRYVSMKDLADELNAEPDKYTKWLKICFEKVMECHRKIF
ncbi:isopentenyl-diphosphate Delta-isomerase [Pedobacter hiemivivus]|uniref:Isopentenyl-diphosphate delta-isomerase n=1 Tax=Pedobacter hiemivivus TaxID=2530454 RepID=A0A4U1FYR4_9SPHI|nr:isopentenyl-diphosphate Delta-isomerase [Pedobacter hiemivivus]TCC92742.1 isopentenyl-diphosphate Delta-isomerase [Pedobacter hiemivivus]TKC56191.1 isopentenyl-diphosphate Delta-isomerase [Pedobacter hiemivivus]